LKEININLQAEKYEIVFSRLKMMHLAKEKLKLSIDILEIQEINEIYKETLEMINAKIVKKIIQF